MATCTIFEDVKKRLSSKCEKMMIEADTKMNEPCETEDDVITLMALEKGYAYLSSCKAFADKPETFGRVEGTPIDYITAAPDASVLMVNDLWATLSAYIMDELMCAQEAQDVAWRKASMTEEERKVLITEEEQEANWEAITQWEQTISFLHRFFDFVYNPNAFARVKESSMDENSEKGKNQYLDLTSCGVSIDNVCKTLISELSDALAMDEHHGDIKDISDDIKCLSYVQTVRDFAIREFTRCKGERNA